MPQAPLELDALIELFYERQDELGQFEQVSAEEMPKGYRKLLAHEAHMTVTVEAHHGSLVDVRVEAEKLDPPRYARKIVLTRRNDGAVVLFGIMRIDLRQVGEKAREEIVSRTKPLGRVLIDHGVLREVELVDLWRIEPGSDLGRLFGSLLIGPIYGRTALIHCNGEPAVELLEIVGNVRG